ncbi:ribosomal protein S18-alanine N-acetyltransferase [Candidatus Profftia tarda]|nr:ribosomal protein S18-alanine N-acetyltransferase [Candidatus Profftia tarda]
MNHTPLSEKFHISTLKNSDFKTAVNIERASQAFPWTEKTFLSNRGKYYHNLKLEYGGTLVAFAITQVVCNEATLFNIAITPSKKRKGLARELLKYLINDLNKKEILILWLEVRHSNYAAIALYESLEFHKVSVRYDYYQTLTGRENAIIMALSLY